MSDKKPVLSFDIDLTDPYAEKNKAFNSFIGFDEQAHREAIKHLKDPSNMEIWIQDENGNLTKL